MVDAIDRLTIDDYTVAIGSKVGLENVIFISKVLQSRVCIYLNSKSIVKEVSKVGNNKIIVKGV